MHNTLISSRIHRASSARNPAFVWPRLLLDELDAVGDGLTVAVVVARVLIMSPDVAGSGVVCGLREGGEHDQAENSLAEALQQGHWGYAFGLGCGGVVS